MSDIYISYRRGTHRGFAYELQRGLVGSFATEQIFHDPEYRVHIRPGDAWEKKLRGAIASARVVLIAIGPSWLDAEDRDGNLCLLNRNDPVRWELEQALARHARGEARLIVVLSEGVALPDADLLPPALAALPGLPVYLLSDRPAERDLCLSALAREIGATPGLTNQALSRASKPPLGKRLLALLLRRKAVPRPAGVDSAP